MKSYFLYVTEKIVRNVVILRASLEIGEKKCFYPNSFIAKRVDFV